MATFVSDTMAGPAGTLLESHTGQTGATWAKPTGLSSGSALLTNANRCRADMPSATVVGYYASGVPAGVAYNVQADLYAASLPTPGTLAAGVCAHMQTGAATFYLARYSLNSAGTNQWELYKFVAGAATLLGSFAEALSAGATYRIQLQVDTASQKLLVSADGGATWTQKVATTDADAALSGAGAAGLHFYSSLTPADAAGLQLSGVTATDGTGAPTQTVPVTDANLFWSPYTWLLSGSTYAQTNTPGAYLKVGFTGTSCALAVDVSPLTGASVAAGSYPTLRYSVDNGPWSDAQLASTTTQVNAASGLAAGSHTLHAVFLKTDYTVERWTTPVNVVRLTGLVIDQAAATAAPSGAIAVRSKRLLVYGDGITEGLAQEAAIGSDSTSAYVAGLAAALGAEVGAVGFGALGWQWNGSGNVPMLYNATDSLQSWNKYSSGQSRLVGGLLSPVPDDIVVVLGTNDALNSVSDGAVQSAVQAWLLAVRTAAPGARIFVCVPFGGYTRTALGAAIAAQSDPLVWLIDLGTAAQAGLSGPQGPASQQSADSIHPRSAVHGRLGALLAAQIAPKLSGGGLRRVSLSGGIGG